MGGALRMRQKRFRRLLILLLLLFGGSRSLGAPRVPLINVGLGGSQAAYEIMPLQPVSAAFGEEKTSPLGAESFALEMGPFSDSEAALSSLTALKAALSNRASLESGRILSDGGSFVARLGSWRSRQDAESARQEAGTGLRPKVVGIRREWRPVEGGRLSPGEVWSVGVDTDSAGLWLRGPEGTAWRGLGVLRLAAANSPETAPPSSGFKLNGREYPGDLEIRRIPGAGGLSLTNRVDIETYLSGVLLGEIYPSWPEEALKAQAVVCRSNALLWFGRHADRGYDVCDGVHCQVYSGSAHETRLTDAVKATYGQVLQYQDKTVLAYFHASSGGRTENNEDVWPGANGRPAAGVPYLRAVDDYDDGSPYFRWNAPKCYTVDELCRLLKVDGTGTLEIKAIMGPSGVVVRYSLARAGGTPVVLTREEIRTRLGLPSPRLDFYALSSEAVAEAMRAVRLDGPVVLDKVTRSTDGYALDVRLKLRVAAAPIGEKGSIPAGMFVIVDGRGYGHGIGMSQWGAKALAERGLLYDEILRHYYTGTEIGQAYE